MKVPIILAVLFIFLYIPSSAHASETNGTIIGGDNNGYAWSDQIGWVNFGCANCNVAITDSGITGYVWNNNYGWINLSPTSGGVSVASDGALSGYAWGENLGWINFSSVSIDSTGTFSGQATGDTVGTLTFDCDNCAVETDYRPESARAVAAESESGAVGGGGSSSGIRSTETTDDSSLSEDSQNTDIPKDTRAEEEALPATGAPDAEEENVATTADGTSSPDPLFDVTAALGTDETEHAQPRHYQFAIVGSFLFTLSLLWFLYKRRTEK